MDTLSFGNGELDDHGFWEHGCYGCARAYEKQFPERGECWPFSKAYLKAWDRRDKINKLKAQLQSFLKKSLDRVRRFW